MIRLTEKYLYKVCRKIQEADYKSAFKEAVKVTCWIKNKKAYAVAANQVGYDLFFFVVRKHKRFRFGTDILFNPLWQPVAGETIETTETCLSYPGKSFKKRRYEKILASFYDPRKKEEISEIFEGLDAIVYQHEVDHLLGIDERIEARGIKK